MFAMSYYGANKVVPTYSVMGPVKAALEACCRYLAYELGSKGIRVHAISPGPLKTRAASGLKDFDVLLTDFRLAGELAAQHGVPTRLLDLCQTELLEAMNHGWAAEDRTKAAVLQEARSGVMLRT